MAPFFVGKDARELEPLLWELYRHGDNYKFQGLALWVCVAAAEFAILDLLGKKTGKSIGDLLGGVKRREIAVYRASGTRGNTPEAEIEDLKQLIAETGAKAIKYRLGGRMSKNADSLPGRSERLIPLVRETFGPSMTLYADANSSYDPAHAIKIGRLMEAHDYAFFEEPCRFDHHEETKQVADALRMPVAGGEQEFSDYGFRYMIKNRVVDIVQPDLHYYGGFIRSLRVARMADAAGMLCTPHMSGSGLGFLDVAHFASCMPNPTPFHEFKGDTDIPVSSSTSSLKCERGIDPRPLWTRLRRHHRPGVRPRGGEGDGGLRAAASISIRWWLGRVVHARTQRLGVGIVALLAALLAEARAQQPYDVVLHGGRIVDGCGTPWYRGDVAIRGGRIVAMGRLEGVAAGRTIDASGLVVAPGFIDMMGQSASAFLEDAARRRQPADAGDHDDQRRRGGLGSPAGR